MSAYTAGAISSGFYLLENRPHALYNYAQIEDYRE